MLQYGSVLVFCLLGFVLVFPNKNKESKQTKSFCKFSMKNTESFTAFLLHATTQQDPSYYY